MITQQGQINTAALVVPDLYVQIVPPSTQFLNGVPSNVEGIIGSATWGPVNSAVTAGNVPQAAAIFGQQQNRLNDLMTAVAASVQQGANNFRLVRVTDGTDTAASALVQTSCITFTSKYSGSFGNQISVTLSAGTKTGTFKAIVAAPGLVAEAFDNIGFGLTANALWLAIASAINNGSSALRGPSQIIVAAAGAGTAAPTPATFTLTGGTDGVTTITSAVMLGQDTTTPRTGMYALRNTGTSVAMLADVTDATTFTTQIAFGRSEGIYMVAAGPSGDTIANAVSTKATAGVDDPWMKLCFGDWIYWLDTVNNVTRVISPQALFAGQLAALSPQNSTLNKPMQAIAGTQKSVSNQQYSQADLQQLAIAGIDLITNPVPGGAYFGARIGHNTSSNPLTNGDNYTRMTNFIAATLNGGMGKFVGLPQSLNLQQEASGTLGTFLDTLQGQAMIGNSAGTLAYSVEIDAANNPQARVNLGYMQADVKVQYLSIVEKFLVNLEGGTSVQITRQGVSLA